MTVFFGPVMMWMGFWASMFGSPEDSHSSKTEGVDMAQSGEDLPSEDQLDEALEVELDTAASRIKRRFVKEHYDGELPVKDEDFEEIFTRVYMEEMDEEEQARLREDVKVEVRQLRNNYEVDNVGDDDG